MRPLRLLLVEDSENDAALLIEHLRQGGYDPDCIRIDSSDALKSALEREWDLVIADYTMTNAVSALMASCGSGRVSSSTLPSRSTIFVMSYGFILTPPLGKTE